MCMHVLKRVTKTPRMDTKTFLFAGVLTIIEGYVEGPNHCRSAVSWQGVVHGHFVLCAWVWQTVVIHRATVHSLHARHPESRRKCTFWRKKWTFRGPQWIYPIRLRFFLKHGGWLVDSMGSVFMVFRSGFLRTQILEIGNICVRGQGKTKHPQKKMGNDRPTFSGKKSV